MKKLLLPLILLSLVYSQSKNATITLYKDGYGLVKQSVMFNINAGRSSINYNSLPDKMEPQSPFLSLQGVDIIYQKYNYDVFDTYTFLKDHLGAKVKVKPLWGRSFKGRLLDVDGKWLTVKKWRSTKIVNLDEVVNISVAGRRATSSVRP